MNKLVSIYDPFSQLAGEVEDNAIIIFDGDDENWTTSLQAVLDSELVAKCILFISTGRYANLIEDFVDDYIVQSTNVFFPTIAETDLNELKPIVQGWQKLDNKVVYVVSRHDKISERLERI